MNRLVFLIVFLLLVGCDDKHPAPDSTDRMKAPTKEAEVVLDSMSGGSTESDAEPPLDTEGGGGVVSQSDDLKKVDGFEEPFKRQDTTRTLVLEGPEQLSKNSGKNSESDIDEPPVDVDDSRFDLQMFSWNVESEGADPTVIAEQLTDFNEGGRYQIFGLTEVEPGDLKKFRDALGKHYKYVFTKSGFRDRMQLLYDESRFEKIRSFEIEEINLKGRYRAPLVLHLKRRQDALEFLVILNHLARGKAEVRQKQSQLLVEWARDQQLPVIALGDYNFDVEIATLKGNEAFNVFLRDNIWTWVQPETLIDTNWFDSPKNPDGKDDFPGSMLDLAFVAQQAKEWGSLCRIIKRPGDFPDDDTTSDHRPYELFFDTD